MAAFVLSVAAASVSNADSGKTGSTSPVQRQGTLAPGHLRPVGETSGQGEEGPFFGQYFDWQRILEALFWNYKYRQAI